MKVKESKVVRFTWLKTFRSGALASDSGLSMKEFCQILRENGISYKIEPDTFGDPQVEFTASFQEVSHLVEALEIDISKLRTYVH